jgi:hypothetical protein
MTDFEAWYLERYPDLNPNLDDAFDELRSAFNAGAASQAMTWQPIETAPKGKLVLLYQPEIKRRASLPARIAIYCYMLTSRPSSHWMHLPAEPTGETL